MANPCFEREFGGTEISGFHGFASVGWLGGREVDCSQTAVGELQISDCSHSPDANIAHHARRPDRPYNLLILNTMISCYSRKSEIQQDFFVDDK